MEVYWKKACTVQFNHEASSQIFRQTGSRALLLLSEFKTIVIYNIHCPSWPAYFSTGGCGTWPRVL